MVIHTIIFSSTNNLHIYFMIWFTVAPPVLTCKAYIASRLFIYSFIWSYIHFLVIYSFIWSFIHLFGHLFIHLGYVSHLVIQSFEHPFNTCIYSLHEIHLFWQGRYSYRLVNYSFIWSFIHWLKMSFIKSFTQSFFHPLIFYVSTDYKLK